ncbi:hypothetical protein J3459_018289 [Metarhizium acridum]|nr:hypothetical protein J3459_018289 [Metarhizium acridum]
MAEDSEDSDSSDSDDAMEQDSVPVPPESVDEIYQKATPFVQKLASDADDKDAHNGIAALNTEIIKATKEYNELHKNNKAKRVSKTQWEIPLRFFQEHYSLVVANYNILATDPNNDEARQKVEMGKKLISDAVLRNHWPADWALNLILPEQNRSSSTPFKYPWPTLQTDDGLIIGVRKRAVGGHQVCVETTTPDGRTVRRPSKRLRLKKLGNFKASIKQTDHFLFQDLKMTIPGEIQTPSFTAECTEHFTRSSQGAPAHRYRTARRFNK